MMKIIILLSIILVTRSLRINKFTDTLINDIIQEEYEDTINILYIENGKIKEKKYHKYLCPLLNEIFIEGHYHELEIEERLKIEHEYLTEIYTKSNFPDTYKENININITSNNSYKYYLFYCTKKELQTLNYIYIIIGFLLTTIIYYYYKNNFIARSILPYYIDEFQENKRK